MGRKMKLQNRNLTHIRIITIILIASSVAIVFELLIGTICTYLNGDAGFQLSLTVGIFLGGMGIGAYQTKNFKHKLTNKLIFIQISTSLLGGFSGLMLYTSYYIISDSFILFMILILAAISILIGMEVPILAELLRKSLKENNAFAKTLSFDYFGSLIGSLVFPLILLPTFGTVKTAFVVGLINLTSPILLRNFISKTQKKLADCLIIFVTSLLIVGLYYSEKSIRFFEHKIYKDEILYTETTKFQRIVLTKFDDDLRLYSDKELQFSSRDEYRYHESLVHPALALLKKKSEVLIIGGGDGLAVRELLKETQIKNITLVDIDEKITHLAKNFPLLKKLNRNSLSDKKVNIIHTDGYRFLLNSKVKYDLIILDFPDPRTETIARLYSHEFYLLCRKRLDPEGLLITQASSPYYAREIFWCINDTLKAVFKNTIPYRIYIPSFGEWGFIIANRNSFDNINLNLDSKYLNPTILKNSIYFDTDTNQIEKSVISTLENPVVWRLYKKKVKYWKS
ncbi:polyamine aminopropyltransferase [Leptospira sp. 96542]|nr:polyamine aminopropyltransferase [Leptospira sp. 96542]